jgi:hypothetical protein
MGRAARLNPTTEAGRAAGEDGFGDVGLGDVDAEVVVNSPEPGVEEVGGTSGKSQRAI